MKFALARALLLATAAIVSCGKGGSTTSGGGGGDAGVHGPTNLVVSWTLAGKPASAATCMSQDASQVFVNLTATLDPTLHQSVTIDCATGTTTFNGLLVEDLGMPYLEGTLLDAMGVSVPMSIVGVDVTPTLGTTTVTLAFFAPQGTGGAGGGTGTTTSSTTTTSSHAASSSSTAASSSSTAASSSSTAASSSSGSGGLDGGDGG